MAVEARCKATRMSLIQLANFRRAQVDRAPENGGQKPNETPTPDAPTSDTCRLAEMNAAVTRNRGPSRAFVRAVDDEKSVYESLGDLLRSLDYRVTLHGSAAEFLNVELPDAPSCLVLDVRLPCTSGPELQEYLTRLNIRPPVILMSGYVDVAMSVKAMKAAAVDFLTTP